MATFQELNNQLATKEHYVLAIQSQAKHPDNPEDVQFLRADALKHLPNEAAAREKMLALHEELKELRTAHDQMVKLIAEDEALKRQIEQREQLKGGLVHPTQDQSRVQPVTFKAFGEQATDSQFYVKGTGYGREFELEGVTLKTLMTTTAGFAPETTRTARISELILRPLQFLDLVPTVQVSTGAIKYMRQLTGPNAAAEVAEGGLKPEASMTFEEVVEPVRKIAEWMPVTDEQLDDVPFLQAMIDQQLREDLLRRLDSQMIVGNGTAPNIRGLLNTVGIQTQAMGADTALDALYKAIVKIRVTGRAAPNAIVIHSNNWSPIRLATATGSGMYLYGPPYDAGPERAWGVPVVFNEALTAGTALVGDTRWLQLAYRQGVAVQVSNSHADYFIYNLQAIRAELRAAFLVYRPSAWCSVTGLGS